MTVVIRIVGLANGEQSGAEGQFVHEYTPNGFEGRGDLVLTRVRDRAKRYPDAAAAMEDWRRVSETHPVRPWDGEPNRPMTAFTVEMISA